MAWFKKKSNPSGASGLGVGVGVGVWVGVGGAVGVGEAVPDVPWQAPKSNNPQSNPRIKKADVPVCRAGILFSTKLIFNDEK